MSVLIKVVNLSWIWQKRVFYSTFNKQDYEESFSNIVGTFVKICTLRPIMIKFVVPNDDIYNTFNI